MRKIGLIIFSISFSTYILSQNNVDSLLHVLDETVNNYQLYANQKEENMNKLKELLKYTSSDNQRYEICERLYYEYGSYKSDSALVYARRTIAIAEKLKDESKRIKSQMHLSSIMVTLGMYKEALDILNNINISKVPDLKGYYFHIYRIIYGSMADYSASAPDKAEYEVLADVYRDSLLSVHPFMSSDYVTVKSDQLIVNKRYDEALKLLFTYYPSVKNDVHERAIMAYSISKAYQGKGDRKEERRWLAVSAINDLLPANKEYVSLRRLAFLLYEDGDIDRAYKYIKRSLDDALFCNARLRTLEISNMMPVIDKAYQHQVQSRQKLMFISLLSISILSILLLLAILFVYRQMKKLGVAQKKIGEAYGQLNHLNQELLKTNKQLKNTNETLRDANLIKEEYIGRYMDQCSIYISKIEEYRRQLNRIASEGKMSEVINAIKSTKFIDKELRDFYSDFDHTFIQLFPTFIDELADLMVDREELQVKQGEILNTGLRVFALIRLGITDSEKISFFLRYSISTIYNCRTRFRNKSKVPRDEFETHVMQIGTKIK